MRACDFATGILMSISRHPDVARRTSGGQPADIPYKSKNIQNENNQNKNTQLRKRLEKLDWGKTTDGFETTNQGKQVSDREELVSVRVSNSCCGLFVGSHQHGDP